MKMSKTNGKVRESQISIKTLKLFATLAATIKERGKSPGMTRVMKSGRKKKVKILSPKTNGKKNGQRKRVEQRSNAQNGAKIRRGTKNGKNNGVKHSQLRKERNGQKNGSLIGTKDI